MDEAKLALMSREDAECEAQSAKEPRSNEGRNDALTLPSRFDLGQQESQGRKQARKMHFNSGQRKRERRDGAQDRDHRHECVCERIGRSGGQPKAARWVPKQQIRSSSTEPG